MSLQSVGFQGVKVTELTWVLVGNARQLLWFFGPFAPAGGLTPVGCWVGWLVGWLVGWVGGWVGRWVGWSVG